MNIVERIPISKFQEYVRFQDGSIKRRCYGFQNPHYYYDNNILKPINFDIDQSGDNFLWKNNIRSVGIKKTDSIEKYLGLRPDVYSTSGEEQCEFSLISIDMGGMNKSLNLSTKRIINSNLIDTGPIGIHNTRKGLRQLLLVDKQIDGFKIIFKIHLKGLKVVEQIGEFWVYNFKNEFVFRIAKPKLIDAQNLEPLVEYNSFLKHSLIDNHDGTFLYTKESTELFDTNLLPSSYYIDSDIYYSSTADGDIFNSDSTWDAARNATTGDSVDSSSSYLDIQVFPTYNEFSRSFLYFDTSDMVNSAISADLKLYVALDYQLDSNIYAQEGTQGDSLALSDYDSFTGNHWGNSGSVTGTPTWVTISFNSTGVAGIKKDGTTKICCRDKRDYADRDDQGSTYIGIRSTEWSSTTYDPYLEITEGNPWTGKFMLVTNPTKIFGIDVNNISKVMGVS